MIQVAAEPAADFHMILVDIACRPITGVSIRVADPDLISVGDAELFLIMGRDKADALSGLLYMLVQPVPAVAVAVQVILPLVGVEAHEVGIPLRVHAKPPFPVIAEAGLGVGIAVFRELRPTLQDAFAEGVDNRIKLILEGLGFLVPAVVLPGGEKRLAAAQVRPQVADAASLCRDLCALRVGVFLFLRKHRPNAHVHRHLSSLFRFRSCSIRCRPSFAQSGRSSRSTTPSTSHRSNRSRFPE